MNFEYQEHELSNPKFLAAVIEIRLATVEYRIIPSGHLQDTHL